MLTATRDLFSYTTADADALCITTNGSVVRVSGGRHATYRGVMGRGCAWQAKREMKIEKRRHRTKITKIEVRAEYVAGGYKGDDGPQS